MIFSRILDLSDAEASRILELAEKPGSNALVDAYHRDYEPLIPHTATFVSPISDPSKGLAAFRRVRILQTDPNIQTGKALCSVQAAVWGYNDNTRGPEVYGWCSILHVKVLFSPGMPDGDRSSDNFYYRRAVHSC